MRNIMLKAIAVAATSLSFGILLACDEETVAAPTAVVATAADEAPAAEPEKKAKDASYSYEVLINGTPRRDPYKTYFDELVTDEVTPTSHLTDLQMIELDKLKLVAVIVGTATPMALVEDPSGKGHTIKVGTVIGKRLGQVKHIRRGEVVVQEEFRDFTGKRIPQLKELKLDVSP